MTPMTPNSNGSGSPKIKTEVRLIALSHQDLLTSHLLQLPVSPGDYSHSDNSNHAMSLGMSQYRAAVCPGHDNLPISDNNVSTTNDALEVGEWDVPETEADLDVSSH